MNSTEATPAPAVGGRQVGQLLAGRYRLGLFKGGDDIADVWHALDESTEKVVTLEILRDRGDDAARQRFLAEAQRMAAIERPSVMRVAAIHNEATDTFIVFEHLIPLPVVLTGLSAIARDVKPATQAAAERTVVLGSVAGPTRSAAEPATTPAAAAVTPAADDASAPTIVDLDEPALSPASAAVTVPLQREALRGVLRTLASTRANAPGLASLATRMAGLQLLILARVDTLIAAARPAAARGLRAVTTAAPIVARATTAAAPIVARAARTAGPIAARAAAAAAPIVARARGNQVVMAGVIGGLLLVAFIVSPLDDMIVSGLRSPGTPATKAASPSGGLAPAPFAVPALSAYGAAFESQGAYPTTAPNGTVEWVVALRNTGSAGWYRGIEGAQAALSLADGSGVAVQSTEYVGPGQVGWFVVHFRARSEVGTYTVQLLPRIDGRGPLPDLGIYTVVTVKKP